MKTEINVLIELRMRFTIASLKKRCLKKNVMVVQNDLTLLINTDKNDDEIKLNTRTLHLACSKLLDSQAQSKVVWSRPAHW